MLDLEARPVREARLMAVELDGETVVYDPADEGLHLLDPIASIIWGCLDGQVSVGVLCEELAESFGIPVEQVQADVVSLTRQLIDKALLRVGESS